MEVEVEEGGPEVCFPLAKQRHHHSFFLCCFHVSEGRLVPASILLWKAESASRAFFPTDASTRDLGGFHFENSASAFPRGATQSLHLPSPWTPSPSPKVHGIVPVNHKTLSFPLSPHSDLTFSFPSPATPPHHASHDRQHRQDGSSGREALLRSRLPLLPCRQGHPRARRLPLAVLLSRQVPQGSRELGRLRSRCQACLQCRGLRPHPAAALRGM